MAAGIEDRFNKGYTYKYESVGDVVIDRDRIHPFIKAFLWVPDGFPDNEKETGKYYDDPKLSPVKWVVYSLGPDFDSKKMAQQHYPVPTWTWYSYKTKTGVITRMFLKNERYIGTFGAN